VALVFIDHGTRLQMNNNMVTIAGDLTLGFSQDFHTETVEKTSEEERRTCMNLEIGKAKG
jgi:hypothetical protein